MAVDLSGMTRKDLEKLRKEIEKQLDKLHLADQKAALEAADRAAREHGFSLAELGIAAPPKVRGKGRAAGSVNPPRYRNPDSGETWSGKGRRPAWIVAADESGEGRAKFEIG